MHAVHGVKVVAEGQIEYKSTSSMWVEDLLKGRAQKSLKNIRWWGQKKSCNGIEHKSLLNLAFVGVDFRP